MVYVFLADGFEEVEAITPIDYLKRSKIEVLLIGVTGKIVTGSHNLKVFTDHFLDEFDLKIKENDMIILPGGIKGTKNLSSNKIVLDCIKKSFEIGSIAAICAAPTILGELNLLEGLKACCYPGLEKHLKKATVLFDDVVVDGNIITSKGAGTAQQFSFKIIEYLLNEEKSREIKDQVQWNV